MACFSFYPTKNLGALGDGGAVVCTDSPLAARVRSLRQYGWGRKYHNELPFGRNSRLDEMQAAVNAINLYEVQTFQPEMKDMAGIVVDAARVLSEAMPLLRDVGSNGARLHELTERLVRMEGHADEIHAAGLKKTFLEYGATDTLKFVVDREIYKHLERIVDAFEDVANQIDGIVIDHS